MNLPHGLRLFPDQDADVEVLYHTSGTGHYDQGGNAGPVPIDPAIHAEYTDLRGNPHIKPSESYFNRRTLLLGSMNN